MSETDHNARHQARMQRKKEVIDQKIEAAAAERGVLGAEGTLNGFVDIFNFGELGGRHGGWSSE